MIIIYIKILNLYLGNGLLNQDTVKRFKVVFLEL